MALSQAFIESMIDRRSANVFSHLAASGVLSRTASSARSMALSTVCQSAAARGFRPASASSQFVSNYATADGNNNITPGSPRVFRLSATANF